MESFLRYLERPDVESAPTEEYLQTLLERYPWFTTARMMLSRIVGKVDPVLSLYLATHPAPGLLLHSAEGVVVAEDSVDVVSASDTTGTAGTDGSTIEVIDRFLARNRGRIVPHEGVPEGDIAVDSMVLDEDLATEELAEIYLAQGLKDQAKTMYTKLSLLYPEKSVYFAEIIARIDGNGADNS